MELFVTADEARAMFNPPYTLQEIMVHIQSVAHASEQVSGYRKDRLCPELVDQLTKAGYEVYNFPPNPTEEIVISWAKKTDTKSN